jgi:S1-C subfamily serine protease
MQKKFIFSVALTAFVAGFAGGLVGDAINSDSGASYVLPAVSDYSSGESPLIAAQKAVAPSVITIVQYLNASDFGDAYLYGTLAEDLREVGGGTGFIIDPSGLAVTNKHVVGSDAYQYAAILSDGTRFDVSVEARDPSNDIAIIRLSAPSGTYAEELLGDLPYAELGNSADLQVGEPVFAIGNALAEYSNTTTAGIISALGRKVVANDGLGAVSNLYGLIQTDAAINFGNSGGPLVNLDGEVIALNTALDDEAQGIGFAIPIDDVKPAISSYHRYSEIIRPRLGVRYIMLTPSKANTLELAVSEGALLIADPESGDPAILSDSSAEKIGLEEEDVILGVNGVNVSLDSTLQDLVGQKQVGDEVTLLIWRDGDQFEVNVVLTK